MTMTAERAMKRGIVVDAMNRRLKAASVGALRRFQNLKSSKASERQVAKILVILGIEDAEGGGGV